MRKGALLLVALLLIIPMFSHIGRVHATSCGFERYKDDACEVYLEYFPIIPYDPNYPTASEEFPIKFYFYQKKWTEWPPVLHVVPRGFSIQVFYKCDCGSSDYVTWKRWFPTSTSQYGYTVSWSLSVGYEKVSLGANIKGEDVLYFVTNYTKYYKDGYLHVGSLGCEYASNIFWGDTYTEGAGSLGIPNDLAQDHEGHHATLWVYVRLFWEVFLGIGIPWEIRIFNIYFYLGDDDPADTDCWLTVEQGNTDFLVSRPSGGGGGCPTLFVWNGTSYAEEGVLDIHAESDVTVQHPIQNTLALENSVYKLQLRELDNYTSHIDQVSLYAVDYQGKWNLCPLIYAYHNELGKVTSKLFFDDNNRVDLEPTQIIDLKFVPSIPYSKTAYFIFEINGYNMKWPGE